MSQSNLDQNKIYAAREDVVSRNNQDGSYILMKMDDSELFFKIDGVAAQVWKGIESKQTLKAIKEQILNEYKVEEAQLNSDIENFFSNLVSKNLLK